MHGLYEGGDVAAFGLCAREGGIGVPGIPVLFPQMYQRSQLSPGVGGRYSSLL